VSKTFRAVAFHPDKTNVGRVRALGLEGPSSQPKLLFKETINAGESFEDFAAKINYIRSEVVRLVRDHGITGMSVTTIDNSAKGKFAVKVTNNVADRIRLEGFLMGLSSHFDQCLFGRLTDLSKRIGETKVSGAIEYDEFRDLSEWSSLSKPWRELVIASCAILKKMEG
jgi:hypothetical protein